jgi:hypothetical protein
VELRSRAWRPAFTASSVVGATAGNVKLWLPPRQSRGISFVSLPLREVVWVILDQF